MAKQLFLLGNRKIIFKDIAQVAKLVDALP